MSEENFTSDDAWVILNSMFKELGLVRQHLDSYNHFVREGLQLKLYISTTCKWKRVENSCRIICR